ncbi:hypothetical protein GCM10007973_10010 [Polymorphobacter multimanifer]|uniref:DUF3108 domain-containing protein n=1 Tax=Polymorphobacter multimanifer TaxID=1070431 RepID=A0A841LF98_9SPHN|nr:hypothetical protein [Polymorphobacter multimanifer]MBB6227648.1 hypothetical protein [Polymorphobacter multimanifer]GGI75165.1 hypothetical protein GCM10007973_10010 [Polymorphobacter multimanifer]
MTGIMPHPRITGAIRYTSKKPELLDQERGRENFAFTRHASGAVTLQAHCEIEEPRPTVMRDILYSIDAEGRPMDCQIRLSLDDEYLGSGWVRFDHATGMAECESHGPTIGRLRQAMPIPDGLDGFGTHPIVGDGYLTRCMDLSKGPHRRLIKVLLPSPDHRGATPPMLALVTITLEYVGEAERTVPAGTFACRHFRFVDEGAMGGNQHPPYDMWVTADADSIFVCGGVGGYMQTWYELVSLTR